MVAHAIKHQKRTQKDEKKRKENKKRHEIQGNFEAGRFMKEAEWGHTEAAIGTGVADRDSESLRAGISTAEVVGVTVAFFMEAISSALDERCGEKPAASLG
jgi:hypothetical protein